ncbi:MAG: alpha-1,4-glucan--maltose-1-phosphate maltosyltransferase [Dehalococcoidia bacterium]
MPAEHQVERDDRRVVIEGVRPEIDGGRFPIKRTVGEPVIVEADAFADGHETITCVLLYRKESVPEWSTAMMTPLGNDRWRAEFIPESLGRYRYAVEAWVDPFKTWSGDLIKRIEAGQEVAVDLKIGAGFVDEAGDRASGRDRTDLKQFAASLYSGGAVAVQQARSPMLAMLMERHPDRSAATVYDPGLTVVVDPERARFSTWYELFPRSASPEPGRHGTFRDVEQRLPILADMGFDVLYLPPIHPIGTTFRKGRNNALVALEDDTGSPWAIGSPEGGHTAIHPELGTLEDFRHLVAAAREFSIDLALDIAFQTSPDHPYVREHPSWFRHRPDGTIQYAENPPKKYQDIYPFNFDTEDWRSLWDELKRVFLYWIEQGVTIFRVDNPHTKPFRFWEWLIAEIKRDHPDVIFLAEAFTRPKVMNHLAKLGFTQSYTYFAWRTARWELVEYLTELTQTDMREYFRPNFWPNTPDILTEYLQTGGRPAFITRLMLAATMTASYGMYGPAFELGEHQPREHGSEEYLHSEKYEIRQWDLDRPESLRELIARVNRIRRANPALQFNDRLRFHTVDNEQLICYSKSAADFSNVILVVVNLDPRNSQSGWVDCDLGSLGLNGDEPFQVYDLLANAYYTWQGPRNYVELNPHVIPAHIFQVQRQT